MLDPDAVASLALLKTYLPLYLNSKIPEILYPITNSFFFFLVTLPAIFLYFSISWVKGKQTLGMRAWKFEIIQKNGDNITFKQSFIRFSLALISLVGLGIIFQFLNKNRLPIHDYYSKTYLSSIYK